jgi:hypothetical protein
MYQAHISVSVPTSRRIMRTASGPGRSFSPIAHGQMKRCTSSLIRVSACEGRRRLWRPRSAMPCSDAHSTSASLSRSSLSGAITLSIAANDVRSDDGVASLPNDTSIGSENIASYAAGFSFREVEVARSQIGDAGRGAGKRVREPIESVHGHRADDAVATLREVSIKDRLVEADRVGQPPDGNGRPPVRLGNLPRGLDDRTLPALTTSTPGRPFTRHRPGRRRVRGEPQLLGQHPRAPRGPLGARRLRTDIGPQCHLRLENGEQTVEVPVPGGGQERLDDLPPPRRDGRRPGDHRRGREGQCVGHYGA